MTNQKLLRLALEQKPCAACSNAGCELARLVLKMNGYVYAGEGAHGITQWATRQTAGLAVRRPALR